MPIAPIVGKLRKRLITDLSMGLGLGFAGGYLFWYTVHKPIVHQRDEYYKKYDAAKA
ncbi:cytochrome-c oxidase [Dioszegia hungarica]|uniref:Cytochrome c oxidase subunit 9, mitochondrial n=1 Tax=Dioszegia hungarica TaxID=4972 RepID=A0AA38HAR3_9TREE|nr:cytochrome-c oxidase [Dioszegia hungarica]KAI9636605.1 cytochrome-c oxidase [Dioszegia hungarica]